MVDVDEILADLAAESADADRMVADLTPEQWAWPTPAQGWTIGHQVAHLAWTDAVILLAITDPAGFAAQSERAATDPEHFVDRGAEEFLRAGGVLQRWRAGRAALSQALRGVPSGGTIPWFGTSMSATSMATARIMETWAHGLDVAEALGVTRAPTPRLRHIAHLGYRTLGWSFLVNNRTIPLVPVRLELTDPDGALRTWGPADARDRVSGPLEDFCLLVVRRRHRDDLALVASGATADAWLDLAQAFAGLPGNPPRRQGTPSEGER